MTHLALVTGAGKRLGRAIALRYARDGCDIAVHYRSSEAGAFAVVHEIEAMGRRAFAAGFDQSSETAVREGFAAIRVAFGRAPNVLVNSASVFEWDDIATTSEASLDRHFRANLFGPVLLTRLVAEAAGEDTRGLILNLLDQKLFNPNPDHLAYTLSKYALQGFTTLMSRTLAPRFRVCAIAPGLTLPGPGVEGDAFDAIHDRTPLQRGPDPEDIADAAAWLLGSPAVTGQTIIVDGGAFMRPAARDVAFE
ncbi:MAG: SDR family oxidoreductase [Alphaproteobacteria bacterium]|nr:SDR family oxidoreductase [Alphaproteobacteria bacterium]